jgi:hypothetical protein
MNAQPMRPLRAGANARTRISKKIARFWLPFWRVQLRVAYALWAKFFIAAAAPAKAQKPTQSSGHLG